MASQRDLSAVGDDRWVWYGGRPSVDFVNTRLQRSSGGRELLLTPPDLDAWFESSGLSPCRGRADAALLAEAVSLREAIDGGIRAVVGELARFPTAAVHTLNGWLAADSHRPPSLSIVRGAPVLHPGVGRDDVRGALSLLAKDAAELLGTELRDRLRVCGGVGCSARFFDNSAGQRRRWCEMATCGNRAKASAHRRNRS